LSSEEVRRSSPPPVRVFSISDNTSIGDMLTCHGESRGVKADFYLTDDGNHFLGTCYKGEVHNPTVFNVRTKEKRVLVRAGFKPVDSFAFNDRSVPKVVSLETSRDMRLYLVLHDLRTGEILGEPSEVSLEVDQNDKIYSDVSFTPDGEYIYVRNRMLMSDDGSINKSFLTLFRTNGLRRVTTVPERDVQVIEAANHSSDSNGNDHIMLVWPNSSGGTFVWDLAEAEPRLLADLTRPEYYVDGVSLSTTGIRAILITREKEQVELWDFKAGKKLRGLDIPSRFKKLEFTIGGNAVYANVEGGTVSLFRAEDGEKITDEIRNIGGSERAIYYDEKCRRVNVWTDEGRVLRYTEGWYLFGREKWFWPAAKCAAQ
jgi:WD40 repeat protein